MAQPIHAKVSKLFDRLMEKDGAAWVDLFAPDAQLLFWFGDRAGRPQTPAEAQAAWLPQPRCRYYNRAQYCGERCFAEAHTVAFGDGAKQRTTESLVVCTLDDTGRVTRFEEFADPSMVAKGPRPVPPLATPPSAVRLNPASAAGAGDVNGALVREVFDKIMLDEDASHLFAKGAKMAQLTTAAFWKGKYMTMHPTPKGLMGNATPNLAPIYTNRRGCAGGGFAIEMHTATLSFNAKKKERRHRLEVAVVLEVDPASGKATMLKEWVDPTSVRRVADSRL